MFPDDIQSYIENEELKTENTASTFTGRTFLYDFKKGDFIYRNGAPVVVEGIKAIQVWVEKVIRTERFQFRIYEGIDYGVTIEDLIGSNFHTGFIESEMIRELTESIKKNPYIVDLKDWSFAVEESVWTIRFTVVTKTEGTFEMEVAA